MTYRSVKPAHSTCLNAPESRVQNHPHSTLIRGLQCLLLGGALITATHNVKAEPMDVTAESMNSNATLLIEDLTFHRLSDGTKPQSSTQDNVDFLREGIDISITDASPQSTEVSQSNNRASKLAPLPRYWHSFSRK